MKRLQEIDNARQQLLREYPDLPKRVAAIRRQSISQLPELVKRLQESLTGKLAKVYDAADSAAAMKILSQLLREEKQVACAYSNTLREIGFAEQMSEKGIQVKWTRLEEIVARIKNKAVLGHPHLPAVDLTEQEVEMALRQLTGDQTGKVAALKQQARTTIKADILASGYGVTGVNGLVAENGVMLLAEDEGNVRAVSNLPYRHIAVVGVEKIAATAEDAMAVMQAACIFGAGKNTTAYYSLIAGPSRTADIEFKMAYGMHGPKEVHVILLDNGRMALWKQEGRELLQCIGCGACYTSCRELAEKQGWQAQTLTPKNLALGLVRGELSAATGLKMSPFSCPVGLEATGTARCLEKLCPQ